MSQIKPYFDKYYPLIYEKKDLSTPKQKVHKIIGKSLYKAQQQYKKLEEPKTISKDLYIDYWIRERLIYHAASQDIPSVTIDDPRLWVRTGIIFTELYSKELQTKLHDKIYQAPFSKRPHIWQEIKKEYSIPKIKAAFQEMMYYRVTEFAEEKDYDRYIDLFFDKYQVPRSGYQDFTDNLQPVIDFCNQKLPSSDQLPDWFYSPLAKPCFSCLQTATHNPLPFANLQQAFDQMTQIYPLLEKFKDKIDLKQENSYRTNYQKETDNFQITLIKSENKHHQMVSLIHELGHVVNELESFQKGINPQEKGTYWRERETFQLELESLKKTAPSLLVNRYANTLENFATTLFDIDLYSNPSQDLDKLYADKFNRCFKGADQKENPTWILKENMVFHPFSSLPYSVGQFQVLNNQLSYT